MSAGARPPTEQSRTIRVVDDLFLTEDQDGSFEAREFSTYATSAAATDGDRAGRTAGPRGSHFTALNTSRDSGVTSPPRRPPKASTFLKPHRWSNWTSSVTV